MATKLDLRELQYALNLRINPVEMDSNYFEQYQNLSFLEFNNKIGLPVKDGKEYPLFDYEIELYEVLEKNKLVWVKKATGLGITEFMLRWIAWKCCTDTKWKNYHVIFITGPRIDLSITLMDRLKRLFKDHMFETKNTVAIINGVVVECFPSHHLDSARGLNPKCIFLDEADFFPPNEQQEARAISERYIAKNDPYIIMVSTPNNPGGLYEQIERETNCIYVRKELNYEVGRDKIYTSEEIAKAKLSPSFEREYNLKYGIGHGNLYPYELVNALEERYDLAYKNGSRVRTIDPAFGGSEGASRFAILESEKIDGIIYPKYCMQIHRASPTAITDQIVDRDKKYPMPTLVDAAHSGLIRDLQYRGVNAVEVVFSKELSNMTMEGTQTVKEKRVRFHPDICQDLTAQLKAVEANDKGHPDKKKLRFDLGDTFQMACNFLKASDPEIVII